MYEHTHQRRWKLLLFFLKLLLQQKLLLLLTRPALLSECTSQQLCYSQPNVCCQGYCSKADSLWTCLAGKSTIAPFEAVSGLGINYATVYFTIDNYTSIRWLPGPACTGTVCQPSARRQEGSGMIAYLHVQTLYIASLSSDCQTAGKSRNQQYSSRRGERLG